LKPLVDSELKAFSLWIVLANLLSASCFQRDFSWREKEFHCPRKRIYQPLFRAELFDETTGFQENGKVPFDAEFLR
jgi:hypothetical protein